MNFYRTRILQLTALLGLVAAAPASQADWATSSLVEAVRPAPDKMQLQPQNPPGFTWSRHPTATSSTWYLVIITPPSGAPIKAAVSRNWLLPTRQFTVPGVYSWKVSPFTYTQAMADAAAASRVKSKSLNLNTAQTEAAVEAQIVGLAEPTAKTWSTVRSFSIDSSSIKFEVPDNSTLRANVMAHPRPRMLSRYFVPYNKWGTSLIAERGLQVKRLTEAVTSRLTLAPLKDSDWPLPYTGPMTAALDAQNTDIRNRTARNGWQAEASALLYHLRLGDPSATTYLNEAIRRGDELAALSPTGPTRYATQDQATRQVAFSLSKTLDMLYDKLDEPRRVRWQNAIRARAGEIYADLAGSNGRMDQFPYDSHGGNTLGFFALIAALNLGNIPEAEQWFDFAVRTYVHQVYTWSGPEGGYANGTGYAQVAADYSVQVWDLLSEALGVSLYRKPWSDGFLRFLIHFLPPGTPSHVFGDGHEDIPNIPLLKAFATRFDTPAGKWYLQNLQGQPEDSMTLLQAPWPLPATTVATAAPPPNAAMYPSVGWAAMHSNLADVNRTSLYFKSSPFGSYNHSHGDQNAIVLNSGGKRLLIEAGYYDWYFSPLWSSWYRATKSHNAITYDGGIGQKTEGNTANLGRNGKITGFSTSSAMDYVEGDALPAYEGELSTAKRKVWYLRSQDLVVVMDTLAAPKARTFEWNFHAAVAIAGQADGSASIVNGDRSLCVRPITTGTTLVKRTGPAPRTGIEDHAAFTLPAASKAEFLVLLDVGCKKPAVKLTSSSSSRTLTVGSQSITLPLP